MSDEQIYPVTAVGALIYNDKGQILLVRGPKFGDFWTIPGGKVMYGESVVDALKREIREEIAVEIADCKFVQYQDAINPTSFHKPQHFLFMDFLARLESGEPTTSVEITETLWTTPSEAREKLKVSPSVSVLIDAYVNGGPAVKNEDYKNNWQRALADYQNLKKEVAERRAEWAQLSEIQILEEFIPVYDNFKKAFAHHPTVSGENEKQIKSWIDGIGYIMKQFSDVMKEHKVEEIKTVGAQFDPTKHETVGEEEVNGSPSATLGVSAPLRKSGEIVREADGGYTLGGRVIKVAKVVVAK